MSQTGSPPTRHFSGLSTSAPGFAFSALPQPTPARINLYHNDFNTYAAGDWTVTAGATAGTNALADGNGGLIVNTTSAISAEIQGMEQVKKSWTFTSNSQTWFFINFKVSHATNSAFMAGLGNTFVALGPTDGVYISKAAATAAANLVVRSGSSTSATLALGTVVADTYYTMGFYSNGNGTLYTYSTIPYLDGSAPGGATGNTAFGWPYYSGGNQLGVAVGTLSNSGTTLTLPTANLTMGWATKTNTTVAQVTTVDYVTCANEIVLRF